MGRQLIASYDSGWIAVCSNPASRVFRWLTPSSSTFYSYAGVSDLVEHIETGSKEPDGPFLRNEAVRRRCVPTESSKEGSGTIYIIEKKRLDEGGELDESSAGAVS